MQHSRSSTEMYLKIYRALWEQKYLIYLKIILMEYNQYDDFVNLQEVFHYQLNTLYAFLYGRHAGLHGNISKSKRYSFPYCAYSAMTIKDVFRGF